MIVDSEEGNVLMMMVVDLIIMAPWLIHFSITFFFSGSVGVSFGPPGISTCVFVRNYDDNAKQVLSSQPGRCR